MNEVKVETAALLEVLKKNRAEHTQLYQDAVEGYKVDTEKKLQSAIEKVGKGQLLASIKLNVPKDHTKDYDRVIRMLEMSVEKELTLRSHEFEQYVLDEWISTEEKHMLRAMALSSSNASNYL
jgi:hypothetical protein